MFKSDNMFILHIYVPKIILFSSDTFSLSISLTSPGAEMRPTSFTINTKGKILKKRRKW